MESELTDMEETRRFLGIVARQSDRLNAIIDDLVTLSKVEQNEKQARVVLKDGPLHSVLREALHICQVVAQKKGVTLELDCPEDVSASINASLLEQAVMNLVDNAVKYSESGSSVHVSARLEDDRWAIRVQDSGCGIETQHLSRLFERFYRVDKARSRNLGGTGLGLAIVKHIAQAHGGQVDVESAPGEGSTFTIYLPCGAVEGGARNEGGTKTHS